VRDGNRKSFLILKLVLLFGSPLLFQGCWIPLPEETAVVVQVFDARGNPVDGVSLVLDGSDTIVTGSQLNEGQVFVSLSQGGEHTLQLDTASLIDPQGGIGWVPLASQISGELLPLSFANRPFAGGSDQLILPVNKGEITVATIFLDDLQKSPMDNQWLTDGSNPSPYRPDDNTDEFRDSPEPVFWWRADPSLGATVTFTFQLWEDDDGDTRFPLGVTDPGRYGTAMNMSGSGFIQPDWQVPLAGIQRVESGGVNQVTVWSSQASDPSIPVDYDLYYAPTSQWNAADWEKNPVLRNVTPAGSLDGTAVVFQLGAGTANTGILLKNAIPYTFALRARDGSSNLDSFVPTSTRKGTPPEGNHSLGAVTGLSATADSTAGGSVDLAFECQTGDDLRIYAAPTVDFMARPFDVRFLRQTHACGSATDSYRLEGLVNGITYAVGMEPFDVNGNIGTASSIVIATPSSASAGDTTAPSTPVLTVTPLGNGSVEVTVSAVTDASSAVRRVYLAPASFTSNEEAMMFTTFPSASPEVVWTVSDIPNGIAYNYVARAIDSFGNASIAASQATLSEADSTGPAWASDDPLFFTTIVYASGVPEAERDLGAAWKYSGFALGRDPSLGHGEYIWRVVQENPERGVSRSSKLGAFYTYSGYYYASTESGGLDMSLPGPGRPGGGPTSNADHRDVLGFVEEALSSTDVMGAPFDSSNASGYRQRTSAQFSASLAAGSGTTNQLTLFYTTDEDGQAVVTRESGGGHLGIIRVFAVNKQRPLPTPEPHLQGKEFQLSYFSTNDELVTFPVPLFGGNIFYLGTLADPDFTDPLW